jgi:hypothetical protein
MCDYKEANVTAERNATFQLLQKNDKQTIDGYVCFGTEYVSLKYCGNYDHQTSLTDPMPRPMTITSSECLTLVKQQMFVDHTSKKHIVVPPETEIIWQV